MLRIVLTVVDRPAILPHLCAALAFAAATLLGAAGCGGGPTLYNVSGKVIYGGVPVPKGQIRFVPDTTQGNTGPGGYADIENGEYDTAKNGQGTTGGPHVVVVTGFDGVPQPQNELPLGKVLFSEWETVVDLPKQHAQGQDFDASKPSRAKARPQAATDGV